MTAFRFIKPCSPIRARNVPGGGGWLHKAKFELPRPGPQVGPRVAASVKHLWHPAAGVPVNEASILRLANWSPAQICSPHHQHVL